jgi:hypothetical protein
MVRPCSGSCGRGGVLLTLALAVSSAALDPAAAEKPRARTRAESEVTRTPSAVATVAMEDCASVTPHAVVALPPGEISVDHESPDDQYSAPNCDRYVIDFKVSASAAQVPRGYDPDFLITASDVKIMSPFISAYTYVLSTSEDCNAWKDSVITYKKASGQATFTRLGTIQRHGEWLTLGPYAHRCIIRSKTVGTSTHSQLQPPASGIDTYRVAVRADVGNDRKPVRAAVFHTNHLPPS